jgi:ribosomal protein S18 acetylase RimI-like enzyme
MEPTWLVAEADTATVGMIAGAIAGDGGGTVHALVVDDSVRRQGVGSRLLDELTVNHRQKGLTEQRLLIHDGNLAAVEFFARHGFRPNEPFALAAGEPEVSGVRHWCRQLDAWSW